MNSVLARLIMFLSTKFILERIVCIKIRSYFTFEIQIHVTQKLPDIELNIVFSVPRGGSKGTITAQLKVY